MLFLYVNLVFFTALNPYIRFLQLPFGEVDPTSALLSLPASVYLISTKSIPERLKYLYPLFFIIFIYTLAASPLFNNDTYLIDYITSVGILLPPLSLLVFFECYKNLIAPSVLNITIILWFLTAAASTVCSIYCPEWVVELVD
ncbi:MAG: hypothetical protein HEP80_14735 [Dolichospermum sp. UKL201]|nr:MAG: hypothetical protein HEP80_14735 [Dolichospermum sp. UKL201]